MRLKAIACGEFALVDAATNRPSLINILDEFASPQFPVLLPLLGILVIFEKGEEDVAEGECEVALDLNGEELTRGAVLLNFGEAPTARAIIQMQGLVIPISGTMTVTVRSDAKELGSWTVHIRQIDVQLGDRN